MNLAGDKVPKRDLAAKDVIEYGQWGGRHGGRHPVRNVLQRTHRIQLL